MTIFLGSDHAGFKLKQAIKEYLIKSGFAIKDLGNHNLSPLDDYPDYAEKVARAVQKSSDQRGILFCGSGEGVCIVANKFKGIRAVVGFSRYAAKQSRADDDANILCLPARVLTTNEVKRIVEAWLKENFSGEARHVRRLRKIKIIETKY